MKKFYSLIIFILLITSSAFAGSITSNSVTGNWNSPSTWVGGVVPGAGDDVTIASGTTVTVTADASCNSIKFLSTATVNSTLNISSGITLTVAGIVTIPRPNTTINTVAVGPGVLVTGGIAFTNGGTNNRHQVTISTGTVVVNGDITDVGSTGSATISITSTGTIKVSGGFLPTINGNFNSGASGTVEYNGAAQTVQPVTYANLTLSGTGLKSLQAGVTVVHTLTLSGTVSAANAATLGIGDLNIGSGCTMTAGGFNFTVGGTATIDGTLVNNSTVGTKTFNNITINSGGVFNSTANEAFTVGGNLRVNGTGSITSGTGTWNFQGAMSPVLDGTGAATITNATFSTSHAINGKYTFATINVSGAGTVLLTNNNTLTVTSMLAGVNDNFVQGANAALNFAGASISISSFTATAAGNTVNYNGVGQTIRGGSYQNLTLSGSAFKTLGANTTVNNTLSMQGTAALSVATFTLNYGASSTLEYAGSTAQISTSIEFKAPGGPTNLKINNANGVTLHAARTVAGVTNFANGILNTASPNILIIGASGTVSGASDASFVNGPVKKQGAVGAGGFDFPVGTTGVGYMKIGIANVTGASTEFTATYVRGSAMTTYGPAGLLSLGIQGVSNCEYWVLDRTVTTSNADVTLYWNSHSPCGGSYLSDPLFGIRIAHYNTSLTAWDAQGGGSPSGDASAGSVTWAGVTNFSPFALAALVGSQSSLPVLFNNVKAFEKNGGVEIDWSNLTEKDLVNYVVERSSNGVSYTTVTQQSPRSNNSDKQNYTAFDGTPGNGANYYRVKALELSGKTIYTKSVRVDIGKVALTFSLYPNPVKGNQFSVSINNKQGQYSLKIMNTSGQELYGKKINHQGGSLTQTIDLPSSVKAGVYSIVITGDNYHESKIFVVQ